MLTYEDCVGLTDLEEEEIEAISQHEHVPEMIAAELGCCLAHQVGGDLRIDRMIRDDIEEAAWRGHPQESRHWRAVLQRFETSHHIREPELA